MGINIRTTRRADGSYLGSVDIPGTDVRADVIGATEVDAFMNAASTIKNIATNPIVASFLPPGVLPAAAAAGKAAKMAKRGWGALKGLFKRGNSDEKKAAQRMAVAVKKAESQARVAPPRPSAPVVVDKRRRGKSGKAVSYDTRGPAPAPSQVYNARPLPPAVPQMYTAPVARARASGSFGGYPFGVPR